MRVKVFFLLLAGMLLPAVSSPVIAQKPKAAASAKLPAYSVLFKNAQFAEVLVPSLSRKTVRAERERVCRAISKREGVPNVTIYKTKAAYKANSSASFKAKNPSAIQGYLGLVYEGVFSDSLP